jgi:hypothetical protein
VDIFFLQLIIIFIPGLIWERIDSQYGRSRATQQWDILRRTFVFGLAAYVITFGLFWCISLKYDGWAFKFFDVKPGVTFLDTDSVKEIAIASCVSLVSSIVWLYATNKKWLTRLLQKIGATKRFGDEDIWEFMFNSDRPEVEYVHVRDFDKKLAYAGWVESWSESEKQRELVLRDVRVSDFDGNQLFETPRVYLARKADNIDIEFPYGVEERPDGTATEKLPVTSPPAEGGIHGEGRPQSGDVSDTNPSSGTSADKDTGNGAKPATDDGRP